ncbi:general secretion pathway protein H [Catenovulum agarivorans DS-2]|uniref:Type II secretion system protein H n=1 Tax=Catenovulum agarivorans DS-2 TaxID=1328313 RepID=W7QEC1_9ALTE|nr:type II secretion system minor pseudopilin GspH [Catenovulum agarivorans]EWH11234.1 general secretion pathway protein H [Catenovulum agarivorans DS-2]
MIRRHRQTNKARFQAGFTLLEVMLVMVLMAVILSSVSLSFDIRSDYDKVKEEARRFQAALQLAADYGLLNNLQLGVIVKKNQYQFLIHNGDDWQTISEDKTFAPYDLEEGFELELTLGELSWMEDYDAEEGLFASTDDEDDEDDKKKLIPQIYLFSSGEITPFTLQFSYTPPYASFAEQIILNVEAQDYLPSKLIDPKEAS